MKAKGMKLKELKIGKFTAKIPIVQGGMSVKNSLSPLAAAVSNAGGIGVIGASAIGRDELISELDNCRRLTPGIVAVNIMYAIREFAATVKTCLDRRVDMIFQGAGFSREIFKMVEGTKTALVSIVSSAKAGLMAERLGADAVVVEGAEAGGHLGTDRSIDEIFPEVRAAVKSIPVLAAGGITDGYDIAKYLKMGADGVQIASRFVCSDECSAPLAYKQMYLNCQQGDIVKMYSPVGYPGRAIRNKLVRQIEDGTVEFSGCQSQCLKRCSYKYCISDRLLKAMAGDVEGGLVFSGANAWKIKEILPAAKIMENMVREAESVA
ncbi:2-nitropropane dioxygenase [Candidatus Termititenax persephonae]|uniref:2-nitropropane dioxygenase n=1 Tax=Candidatus Termititenax persephonae TaxID=2218525 RepID=A0A388TH08_9BACT|nr:2-nitropropane dioxygenase [Candidatus Termititenax persephonae]